MVVISRKNEMPYKVIQWSTGYTGKFSLKYILNNPG